MILSGKEAKELFTSKKGILFFDAITLAFVNCQTLERTYKFSDEDLEPGERKIVISDNFDLVKLLKNEKNYIIKIEDEYIVFRNAETNHLDLVIKGVVNF